MNAAVFLDRDNTIIHNDGDLGDPDLVRLIQGAASAIASLRGLNYKIIIITNQGGVARGKYGEADVEKTNQRVADLVKAASGANIDRFYYCPYHPQGSVPEYTCEHEWRKPQPGMLLQAAKDMNIDLSQSWMVGDQMRDVQAGTAAGTRCILLRADAQELLPLRGDQLKSGQIETTGDIAHFTARTMVEAVRIIAKQRKPESEQVETERKKWNPAAVKAARMESNPPEQSTTDQAQAAGASSPAQGNPNARTNPPAPSHVMPASSGKPARTTPPKPFKPWGASGSGAKPAAQEPVQKPQTASQNTSQPAKQPVPAPVQPPVKPDLADSSLEPHEVAQLVAQDELSTSALPAGSAGHDGHSVSGVSGVSVVPVDASSAAAADSLPASDVGASSDQSSGTRRPPSSDVTLRQILQELRGQRTIQNDFSYVRMIAIVLQIVAVFLLVAGLLLGASDVEIFLRWIATAILVQLAAIALLLLER